jgi:protein gp37
MMFAPGNRHTYLILTKRPERLMKWMRINYDPETMHRFAEEQPNIWLGVTAENQVRADERIPILLSIPAAVHFVSAEPLLERVDLCYSAFNGADSLQKMTGIDWVIAGPETGSGAREYKAEWIQDMADQCGPAGVPFFDKSKNFIRREWPEQSNKEAKCPQ